MKSGDVKWKFGVDSHDEILKQYGIRDQNVEPDELEFARVEVTPDNGDYLFPDRWTLRVDERIKPKWFTASYELFVMDEHKKWVAELDRVLIRKKIINPLSLECKSVTEDDVALLRVWASIWASVRDSVCYSVCDSVCYSIWASVRDSVCDSVCYSVCYSVWDSVRDSVCYSVRDSVWGYIGSFFSLPKEKWLNCQNVPFKKYPFESVVELWERGLVPSFDGTTWRLHGGKNAAVLWEGKL